ncbi:MAG: rane protein [Variovorax sp.]|nr:rane protein [Variovorax sp.]
MGSFSTWHGSIVLPLLLLLPNLLLPNLLFIPAARKAGFSAWWVVLSLVPLMGIVLLWLFAFAKWPAQPNR